MLATPRVNEITTVFPYVDKAFLFVIENSSNQHPKTSTICIPKENVPKLLHRRASTCKVNFVWLHCIKRKLTLL